MTMIMRIAQKPKKDNDMKNAEVIDVLIDPFFLIMMLLLLILDVQIDVLLFFMHQVNKMLFLF